MTSEKKLSYFRTVQQELKRVNWTTKEELVVFTKIVVGATLVCGFGIYVVDLFLRGSLRVIELVAKWIGG